MSRPNRWTSLPHLPLTKTLYDCFPRTAKKDIAKPEIVSEKLCDDVLHRLSPLLLRNRPVDIVDLWPGAGLLSSKVNDLLQPRRHILVEPNMKTFKPMLQPLVDSRSCYKLLSTKNIHQVDDLQGFLTTHLPEQGPSNSDRTGPLTRNDTLLVLASPPVSSSKKDHFTPARWWASFMDSCMRNTGLNSYGSVRLLASLPTPDAQAVLPRTSGERKRPALVTECIALHAFEAAAFEDSGYWVTFKGWDLVEQSTARVAQRAAAQGVVTPKDREVPPYELAPESPNPGQTPYPYVPRPKTPFNTRLFNTIKSEEERAAKEPQVPSTRARNGKKRKISQKHMRSVILLNQENRHAFARQEFSQRHAEIDTLTRSLSRAAADPQADSATLRPILDQIEALKSALVQQQADVHFEIIQQAPITVDDRRAVLGTDNVDESSLLWDRRPFEPLLIQPEELYPRESERSLIYFEADPNPPAIRKLHQLDPAQKSKALRLFEALTFTLGSRGLLSVTELLDVVFPSRSINSLVQAIPSLATFAAKTPKPDFDSLPKTVIGDAEDPASTEPLDPADCYQENLDYDLSGVRVRCLSIKTILDICVEYQRYDQQHSLTQLIRILGGMLTTFRTGEHLMERS